MQRTLALAFVLYILIFSIKKAQFPLAYVASRLVGTPPRTGCRRERAVPCHAGVPAVPGHAMPRERSAFVSHPETERQRQGRARRGTVPTHHDSSTVQYSCVHPHHDSWRSGACATSYTRMSGYFPFLSVASRNGKADGQFVSSVLLPANCLAN